MDTAPLSITRSIALELIDAQGGAIPLAAELHYDARDPYAVAACFRAGRTDVRWTFARSLLAEGVHEPTGDGDVHIWPCLDSQGCAVTVIELSSPDGEALMQACSRDISAFVARTESLVPTGTESSQVDVDHELDALLAGPELAG